MAFMVSERWTSKVSSPCAMTVDVSVPEQCMEFARVCRKENELQMQTALRELDREGLELLMAGKAGLEGLELGSGPRF